MKMKRELITYLISGGVTTGVNYLLYAGYLRFTSLILLPTARHGRALYSPHTP